MAHILDTYAMSCGLKHNKPNIVETFYPISTERYVTIHNSSKTQSKEYDFFDEVVGLLLSALKANNIDIVQIGSNEDKIIRNTICLNGKTSIRQTAYIIKNSLLHIGIDSAPIHIASVFSRKIVGVYANNYIDCIRPYWTKPEDCILLTTPAIAEGKAKPSFSLQENPKSINTIPPEKIAKAVGKLLGFEVDYPYSQVWTGPHYQNAIFEMVPNTPVDLRQLGTNNIIVRMDFEHNEQILEQQMQMGPVAVICNEPISLDLLKKYKPQVQELIYIIGQNHCPDFVEGAQRLGLNRVVMISKMPEEELNKVKLYYLDLGLIVPMPNYLKESILEIKGVNELFYRTRKYTISKGQVFPSKAAWLAGLPVNLNQLNTLPVVDNDEFWNECQHFCLLKKD